MMTESTRHTRMYTATELPDEQLLLDGSFVVLVHAHRVPPHIGMILNKGYHSLSIKGHELEVSPAALIKNCRIRKIPTVFFQLTNHPTFSSSYLSEHFQATVQSYGLVDGATATCISPVRDFFREVYNFPVEEGCMIHQLIPALMNAGLIQSIYSINIDGGRVQLPVYSQAEVDACIDAVRSEIESLQK